LVGVICSGGVAAPGKPASVPVPGSGAQNSQVCAALVSIGIEWVPAQIGGSGSR
jgi:hypothetical protein